MFALFSCKSEASICGFLWILHEFWAICVMILFLGIFGSQQLLECALLFSFRWLSVVNDKHVFPFQAFEKLTPHCDKYQMLPFREAEEDSSPNFSWGVKKGKGALNKGVQFYKSFTYEGVDFSLYDCVYMCRPDEDEPDIGKVVKIWETAQKKRMVKVVWFFRPTEVIHWLGNIKLLDNELLLASGEGIGLSNCNRVVIVSLILFSKYILNIICFQMLWHDLFEILLQEAITGKCNVVCISTDTRNPQPKDEDLDTADFVFCRTFDVRTREISEEFPNSIAQIEGSNYNSVAWFHPVLQHCAFMVG